MKSTKKVLSALLAAAMTLAISAPVLANETPGPPTAPIETGDGSITVTNAANGKDYSIYKIFDLSYAVYESDKGLTKAYAYSVEKVSPWYGFVNEGAGKSYVKLEAGADDTWYVTWNKDLETFPDDAKAFADAAISYAKSNGISANCTKKAANDVVTFDSIPLGYYLVTSAQRSLVMLNTTNKHADIVDKNTHSVLTKTVNDKVYDIGEEITFTLSLPITDENANEKTYVIHDKMGVALDFVDNSIIVKIDGEEVAPQDVYTIVYSGTDEEGYDGCTFEIRFAVGKLKKDDKVTVTYKGKLNNKAINPVEGENDSDPKKNENKAWLNDQPPTRVFVYTANVVINKSAAGSNIPLANAKFILYKEVENTPYYYYLNDGIVAWTDEKREALEVTTDKSGAAFFNGLGDGTYYLEETEAPEGYNKLSSPTTIVIPAVSESEEKVANINGAVFTHTEEVVNHTGTLLPSTGGMGTTLMIAVGSVLLIVAGVLLVTKRRMNIIGSQD